MLPLFNNMTSSLTIGTGGLNIRSTCWVALVADEAAKNLNHVMMILDEIADKMKRICLAVFILLENIDIVTLNPTSMSPAMVSLLLRFFLSKIFSFVFKLFLRVKGSQNFEVFLTCTEFFLAKYHAVICSLTIAKLSSNLPTSTQLKLNLRYV